MSYKPTRVIIIIGVVGIVIGLLALMPHLLVAQAAPQIEREIQAGPTPKPHVVATIPFSPSIGFDPTAVGINPATGYVYVANSMDDVSILSGTQVITNVRVSGRPLNIVVNPATGYIYVALESGNLAMEMST